MRGEPESGRGARGKCQLRRCPVRDVRYRAPFGARQRDSRNVRQLAVPVDEAYFIAGGLDVDWRLLLAVSRLRFLDVREVGFENPGQLERQRRLRAIRKNRRRGEVIDVDLVGQREVDAALGNPFPVARLFVPRLAAAAAFVNGNLRIGIHELQQVRRNRSGLAQPRALAVDFQPHRAQEARFAKVEAGERPWSTGVARCRDDEQRRTLPGAQNVMANERARSSTLARRAWCGFPWRTPSERKVQKTYRENW